MVEAFILICTLCEELTSIRSGFLTFVEHLLCTEEKNTAVRAQACNLMGLSSITVLQFSQCATVNKLFNLLSWACSRGPGRFVKEINDSVLVS